MRITSTPSAFGLPPVGAEAPCRNGARFEAALTVVSSPDPSASTAPPEPASISGDSSSPAQVDIDSPADRTTEETTQEIHATTDETVPSPWGPLPWDGASALPAPNLGALHNTALPSVGAAQAKVIAGDPETLQESPADHDGTDPSRDSALDQPASDPSSTSSIFQIAPGPVAKPIPPMSRAADGLQAETATPITVPEQALQPLPVGNDQTPPHAMDMPRRNGAVAVALPVTDALAEKPLALPDAIRGSGQPSQKDGPNWVGPSLHPPATDALAPSAFESRDPSRAGDAHQAATRALEAPSQITFAPARPIANTVSDPPGEIPSSLASLAANNEPVKSRPTKTEQSAIPGQPVGRPAVSTLGTAASLDIGLSGVDQPFRAVSATMEAIPNAGPVPQRTEIRNAPSSPIVPAGVIGLISQSIQPAATAWRPGRSGLGEDASSEVLPALTAISATIPTPTQVSPAEGAAPPSPSRQLAEAILSSGTETRETELTLMPEELGRVRFAISNTDGVVTISITADRPETLALLRRNVDILATDLSQSGLQGASIDFGASGQHRNDGRAARSMLSARQGATDAQPVQAIATAGPRAQTTGRLDLRL